MILCLFDMMMEIYIQFGMYREELISIKRTGKKGAEEIQEMMVNLRANPPKEVNGSARYHMVFKKRSPGL